MKKIPCCAFVLLALLWTAPAASAHGGHGCFGAVTAAFAQMGEMGPHASQQPTPRLGLARLARALFEMGVIDAPTLEALAAFLAAELGLSIPACD